MGKIVLLGDSITEYLSYNHDGNIGLADEVVNYGFENVGVGIYLKHIWPQIDHNNVDLYILLIGINNFLRPDCDYDGKESFNDTIAKLKKLIAVISNENHSKLIVQSIYPTTYPNINKLVIDANVQIENYCNEIGVLYLDIYSLLIDNNGLFDSKYRKDNIHPNKEGYKLVINKISDEIKYNNMIKCK